MSENYRRLKQVLRSVINREVAQYRYEFGELLNEQFTTKRLIARW